MGYIDSLPDYTPPVEIVKLPDDWDITYPQSSQFPPIRKFTDGRVIVDMFMGTDGGKYGKAWERKDHPNLEKIPANAPRIVKSLYRESGQLGYLRGNYKQAQDAIEAFSGWRALNNFGRRANG